MKLNVSFFDNPMVCQAEHSKIKANFQAANFTKGSSLLTTA